MPLKVQRDPLKKLEWKYDDNSIFTYRQMGYVELSQVAQRNLVNGEVPESSIGKVAVELMELMVDDITGLEDDDTGEALEYSPELITGLAHAEPTVIKRFFEEVIMPRLEAFGILKLKKDKPGKGKKPKSKSGN